MEDELIAQRRAKVEKWRQTFEAALPDLARDLARRVGDLLARAVADGEAEHHAVVAGRPQPGEETVAKGCPFAPRCVDVMDGCRSVDPAARAIGPARRVRCHLYPETATAPGS